MRSTDEGWPRDGAPDVRSIPLGATRERPPAPPGFLSGSASAFAAPVLSDAASRRQGGEDWLQRELADSLRGRYEIAGLVGSGGMALVFRARDVRHERDVAIKVVRPEVAGVGGGERFAREIAVVAQLQHPHIVPLHDSGDANGLLYYVMPFVSGETLRDRLRREPRLPVADVLVLVTTLAAALAHAHGQGIIHRDIKPENVLLHDGHAMLADFGIALVGASSGESRITLAGVTIGTPRYMSPEQARGSPLVGPASDVYALAAVAYEALTGRLPIGDAGPASVGAGPCNESVAAIRADRPDVPAAMERAILRALSHEPTDRFAGAREFARAAARPEPPEAVLPWRAVLPRAALAALVAALWLAGPESPRDQVLVVVVPLSVDGPRRADAAYLAGIGGLLAARIDGAGALRALSSGEASRLTRREGASDPPWRELARRRGAHAYVTGQVRALADERVVASLTLHRVDGERPADHLQATAHGDSLAALVDDLARQLLVRLARPVDRAQVRAAGLTTTSGAALKAFLRGEHHFRERRLDSAAAEFAGALREDSTFALARHRYRVVRSFSPAWMPTLGSASALHADTRRLGRRERLLINGFAAFADGRATEAEHFYTQALREYGDEVEPLFFLADTRMHYRLLWGLPTDSVRVPLERLLAIDPTHLPAIEHLAQIAGTELREAEAASLWARAAALERGEYAIVARAAHAFWRRDAPAQARVLEELARADDSWLWMAALRAGPTHGDPLGGRSSIIRLMTEPRRPGRTRARAYAMLADLALARGRRREASAYIDSAATISPDAALAAQVVAILPWSALDTVPLVDARARRAAVIALGRAGATDSVRLQYLVGILSARVGEVEAARAAADSLRAWSGRMVSVEPALDGERAARRARDAALLRDLARTIAADVERRRGRVGAALDTLAKRTPAAWWTFSTVDALRAQGHERWLHAELLALRGRPAEAIHWYRIIRNPGLGMAWGAPGRWRIAQMEERLGRREAAAIAYEQFAMLWKDADPELQPLVATARRRAAMLRR